MVTKLQILRKLHKKVKKGTATEPEKRKYKIFLRELAQQQKAVGIFRKLPMK